MSVSGLKKALKKELPIWKRIKENGTNSNYFQIVFDGMVFFAKYIPPTMTSSQYPPGTYWIATSVEKVADKKTSKLAGYKRSEVNEYLGFRE